MKVIILGGTGTLAKAVLPLLLEDPQIERIRILSRNEHTQAEMNEEYRGERIDYFIGDIRDLIRIETAIKGCQEVYHFAATKRVESCEYNPDEAIATNVIGTRNIIWACIRNRVSKAMYTSTDKAVEPLNVYGLTKALAEKRWIQGNIGGETKFAACRYGNVWGSHGSVGETWKRQKKLGQKISVVSQDMTRFFIRPEEAAKFVVSSMRYMNGGEIFIPKMKSTKMSSLVQEIEGELVLIPRRPGEKIHEKLIADAEDHLVTDVGDRFIRWPEYHFFPMKRYGGEVVTGYSSEFAEKMTKEELKNLCSTL